MTLSLYIHADTWIHRLDARTKTVCVLVVFALALVFSDPSYLAAVTVAVLTVLAAAQALRNVRAMWPLLLLLFVYSTLLWPWFVTGHTPWFEIGAMVVTTEAIDVGVGMGIRLNLMVLTGILLLSTTTVEDFAVALQRCGLSPAVGFAFAYAFRWVPMLLGASRTIVQAQEARGLDLDSGSIVSKIRGYVPLVVPLIGNTLRQSGLIAMALEAKGYAPGRCRRPLHVSQMRLTDYVVLCAMAVIFILACWARFRGYGVVRM